MDWKNWKTWKNEKTFSSQGISNRLEKSGNFTQNTGKSDGNLLKILEAQSTVMSLKITAPNKNNLTAVPFDFLTLI